jgi:hypothetical protein
MRDAYLPEALDGLECPGAATNNHHTFSDKVASTAREFRWSALVVLERVCRIGSNVNLSIGSVSFERMECAWGRSIL